MRKVNCCRLKHQFGEFLDIARDEPVGIRKSGKLTAVMLSADEYEHLQRLEDAVAGSHATKRQNIRGSGLVMKKQCSFWRLD